MLKVDVPLKLSDDDVEALKRELKSPRKPTAGAIKAYFKEVCSDKLNDLIDTHLGEDIEEPEEEDDD